MHCVIYHQITFIIIDPRNNPYEWSIEFIQQLLYRLLHIVKVTIIALSSVGQFCSSSKSYQSSNSLVPRNSFVSTFDFLPFFRFISKYHQTKHQRIAVALILPHDLRKVSVQLHHLPRIVQW